MISIKNVSKIYPSINGEVRAVDHVSLDISEGEIFGVIGYSGAGKSTLIRMLNGLEIPTTGKVLVANNDVSKIKGQKLRKARHDISMIFQHFNLLWSRTVRENISLPLEIAGVGKAARNKKVEELIELVGLDGKGNAYPSELSGGQKQRVGIARALANNPKVLLCDEATSALDPQTTDSILDLLVNINKRLGLTIVLITHEMHVIRKICHRVAVMESGKVVELGSVLDVFKNPKEIITKRFVQQVNEPVKTIDQLLESYPKGKAIRLKIAGEQAKKPIITTLVRDYSLTVSILQGSIAQTQKGPYGTLFIHLDGESNDINRAIDYLNTQPLTVEVIKND
ncbi:methionine ABC transporter ATP-binding protein [Bacillus sp. 03113]|uniref:methionine ABC transporter ATP-binding protein n=1 Tax=Bacillus sp. 03113 TaxID=2578211 RepID=UPI00114482B6|nr:methionine ABC transporter ATP-binding protein [Bacillus sp. 03113]